MACVRDKIDELPKRRSSEVVRTSHLLWLMEKKRQRKGRLNNYETGKCISPL